MATNASPSRLRKKISNQRFTLSSYSVKAPRECDPNGTDSEAARRGQSEAVDEAFLTLERQLHDERHDNRRAHYRRDDPGPERGVESQRVPRADERENPGRERGGEATGHTPNGKRA